MSIDQKEAVLDLYESVRASWTAWEQQEASELYLQGQAEANGSQDVEAYSQEPVWIEALEKITQFYNDAREAGVEASVLDFVLANFMPPEVADRIHLGNEGVKIPIEVIDDEYPPFSD